MSTELQSTDFLLVCSEASLGDFELARLNRTANLRKQMRALESEMLRLEAEALLARWLREHRGELVELGRTHSLQKTLDFVDCPIVKNERPAQDRGILGALQHRFADAD